MKAWSLERRLASARERLYANRNTVLGGCWEWTGYINKQIGYGYMSFCGYPTLTHRVSWIVHHSAIPEGICVLHRCDNPACFNPEHLFLGTHQANTDDKLAKGRLRHGHLCAEANPGAKLTQVKAAEIRRRCDAGESTFKVAAELGVNQALIWRIWRGKSWRYASPVVVMTTRRSAVIES